VGKGDSFALALADQRPFKFSEGAHYREQQICHGRILAGKMQPFLDELNLEAMFCKLVS
jgi:hypothetical protein